MAKVLVAYEIFLFLELLLIFLYFFWTAYFLRQNYLSTWSPFYFFILEVWSCHLFSWIKQTVCYIHFFFKNIWSLLICHKIFSLIVKASPITQTWFMPFYFLFHKWVSRLPLKKFKINIWINFWLCYFSGLIKICIGIFTD